MGGEGLPHIQSGWPRKYAFRAIKGELCYKSRAACLLALCGWNVHGHGRIVLIETQPEVMCIGSHGKQLRAVGSKASSTWTTAFLSVGGLVCKGPQPSQARDLGDALHMPPEQKAESPSTQEATTSTTTWPTLDGEQPPPDPLYMFTEWHVGFDSNAAGGNAVNEIPPARGLGYGLHLVSTAQGAVPTP